MSRRSLYIALVRYIYEANGIYRIGLNVKGGPGRQDDAEGVWVAWHWTYAVWLCKDLCVYICNGYINDSDAVVYGIVAHVEMSAV